MQEDTKVKMKGEEVRRVMRDEDEGVKVGRRNERKKKLCSENGREEYKEV